MRKIKGFTLMETLIYIALFSLIIFFGFVTAFELIRGSDKLSARKVLIEESNFVKQKLERLLSDVSVVNIPSASIPNADVLSLINTRSEVVDVRLNVEKIEVRVGGASHIYLPLTTENVAVTALNFEYIGGAIKASFTMNGVSFTTTKYLSQ